MNKTKAIKYLVLLIVCLLIMFLGSVVILPLAMQPLLKNCGYSTNLIYEALNNFQNYFSTKQYDDTVTWAEHAQEFFDRDPLLFKNIKTFYCAVQFLSYMPLLVLIIFFLREEFVEDFVKFKKNKKKNFLLILIGVGAMYASALVISMVYQMLNITGDSNNEQIIDLLLNSPGMILMVIAVVILAPITEEVIFRKLMIGTCEEMFRFPPWLAIGVSALVFSFIHVTDLESLKFIFQYLALALPICIVYHFSDRNIYVTISMHIINNLISVLTTLLIK